MSLFLLYCLIFQSPILKADVNSFGHRIFVMQEKQANKGNALAQFELGTFYEFGLSVKPDTEKAKAWYEKAAKQKNEAASSRLIYLDIKENGYNESLHANWLSNVSKKANNGRADSLIILGQLYQHGLGVKKDLKKAVKLLSSASSLGHAEVDKEIALIKEKIAKTENKAVKKKQPAVTKKVEKKSTRPAKAAPKKTQAQNQSSTVKRNKERDAAIKRQKYEETMRKLYLETLILQQQQEWTEESEE